MKNMARPDKNRQMRRENLREELKAREYLRQLEQVDEIVSENWKTLGATEVAALRLKADINFKRLAKVLPDVKAIEMSGPDGEDVTVYHKIERKLLDGNT